MITKLCCCVNKKMKKVDGIVNLFDLAVCFCTQREIWQFVIYFIV